jgi:hypothetical protein
MTSTNSKNPLGIFQQLDTLVKALAEKGTPGIILLAIIFLPIWVPVAFIFHWFFDFLGAAKDFPALSTGGPLFATVIVGILCIAYISVACFLTLKIIGAMIPTIKAEAEAAKLLQNAFGGRVITSAGTVATLAVDKLSAERRTKQIMEVLLGRAKSVLRVERVRSNIFTLNEDGRLRILDDFHLNMLAISNKNELTIAIPNGLLSSGRAYKYYRPVLSIKSEKGDWPYADDYDRSELKSELQKAHPDLKWIISMPIPCEVKPFKLVSGVLNIDGFDPSPNRDQMLKLLPDMSTAAALIAVLNRSTGFLKGLYITPSVPSSTEQERFKDHLINPEDFNPAFCPEPSSDFVRALAHVQGLEFFDRISAIEVASFLRNQLRS